MTERAPCLTIRRLTVRAVSETEAARIAGEFRDGLAGFAAPHGAATGAALRLQLAPGDASGTTAARALARAIGGGDGR